MTPAAVILTVAVYIAVLFVVAYLSGRKADNAGFFTGNRRTPWYMAALAMIGAAISGVTFISVARIGGRRLLLLHADGVGIHGRADGRRLRADPALL